jgi:hypothetical protein
MPSAENGAKYGFVGMNRNSSGGMWDSLTIFEKQSAMNTHAPAQRFIHARRDR